LFGHFTKDAEAAHGRYAQTEETSLPLTPIPIAPQPPQPPTQKMSGEQVTLGVETLQKLFGDSARVLVKDGEFNDVQGEKKYHHPSANSGIFPRNL
jgi:hypothetical protein